MLKRERIQRQSCVIRIHKDNMKIFMKAADNMRQVKFQLLQIEILDTSSNGLVNVKCTFKINDWGNMFHFGQQYGLMKHTNLS